MWQRKMHCSPDSPSGHHVGPEGTVSSENQTGPQHNPQDQELCRERYSIRSSRTRSAVPQSRSLQKGRIRLTTVSTDGSRRLWVQLGGWKGPPPCKLDASMISCKKQRQQRCCGCGFYNPSDSEFCTMRCRQSSLAQPFSVGIYHNLGL